MNKGRHSSLEYTRKYEAERRHPCIDCGKIISRPAKRCYTCRGKKTSRDTRGAKNPNWKGGRRINNYGYVRLSGLRGHPQADSRGCVFEHRFVWEKANGPVPEGWQIHHINGIKTDNRLENLIALPIGKHNRASPLRMLLKKTRQRIKELEYQLNQQNHLL